MLARLSLLLPIDSVIVYSREYLCLIFAVLLQFQKRLVDNTRSTDICARMGGDEFVVIAIQLESEPHAHQIALKLLQQYCSEVDINNKNYRLGASISVSIYPTHDNDLTQLLKSSDDVIYKVKKWDSGSQVFEGIEVVTSAIAGSEFIAKIVF